MDANAIVNEIGKINANIQAWESECSKLHYHLSKYEGSIVQGKTRLDELWTRLRATLDAKDETAKPQTDDTPQTDDDGTYSIVRRSVRIDGVRWVKDGVRILEVTVTDDETHKAIKLFTDDEPCIKACIYGLGESIDIKYDENSGELLETIVGE